MPAAQTLLRRAKAPQGGVNGTHRHTGVSSGKPRAASRARLRGTSATTARRRAPCVVRAPRACGHFGASLAVGAARVPRRDVPRRLASWPALSRYPWARAGVFRASSGRGPLSTCRPGAATLAVTHAHVRASVASLLLAGRIETGP